MKLIPLLLSGALILGSGFASNALAHDGGRGYGKYDHGHYDSYRRHRHGHNRKYYKRHHRGWRHGPAKRHYYERPKRYDHDSWYGIHLFFGGH